MSRPSDNIYSAVDWEDDDDEQVDSQSLSDELSPSDGYFNDGGRIPSNTMVPDPSMDRKERVEDKTLIPPPNAQRRAGESSRMTPIHPLLPRSPPSQSYASQNASSNSPTSPTLYTPASSIPPPRSEDMYSENSALLNDAPPAYTPSPVSPTTTSEPVDRSYRTFQDHHLESGIPPTRQPESMGVPTYEPTERTPLVKLTPARKRWLKHFGIAVVVLIVFTMLTAGTFHHDKSVDNGPKVPGDGNDQPSKSKPDNAGDNRPIDSSTPYCTAATHKENLVTYEFPVGSDLAVIQTLKSSDESHFQTSVSTFGEIRLRRLPKDGKHGNRPHFTVDVRKSDYSFEVETTWNEESQILKIVTPKSTPLNSREVHCVSLEITAWIPENAQFDSLLIEATSLTLRVVDDIKVNVSKQAKFTTISGNVRFPAFSASDYRRIGDASSSVSAGWRSSEEFPFSSRRIIVETLSGNIKGNYPLMDFLGLSTQSGDIKTDVFPQPVLPSAPAAADLEVQTSSGTIHVNCPVGGELDPSYIPPPRNYITSVHSISADIYGSYYLGSQSVFKSTSGTVKITGLPVLRADDSTKNKFDTQTVSGTMTVTVLDPIFISLLSNSLESQKPAGDNEPYLITPPSNLGTQALFKVDARSTGDDMKLRTLDSTHVSNSGDVKLQYPEVWEGNVHAKTISGGIKVQADGMRVIRDRKGYGSKEIMARKGVEEKGQGSSVEMHGISGNLAFIVGQ